MQKELAAFLKRCPGGVVALDNAQKLHPALLPVFINALSEQGSFEVPPLPCLDLFSSIGICCALPCSQEPHRTKLKALNQSRIGYAPSTVIYCVAPCRGQDL